MEDKISLKNEQSQQMLDMFKQEQERVLVLKNEERRLKEEDIRKLRERQKRLLEIKKNEIIDKDLTSTSFLL